jgi:hypothetical protein
MSVTDTSSKSIEESSSVTPSKGPSKMSLDMVGGGLKDTIYPPGEIMWKVRSVSDLIAFNLKIP